MANDADGAAYVDHLQEIELTNFRCYEQQKLVLAPGSNFFLGTNGQGKTTVLEAIYFLSLLRSFRTHQVRHLLKWREKFFCVRGKLLNDARATDLGVMHGEKRQLRRDGATVSKASDFIANYFCVAFTPEDIHLIQGPGQGRRRFLDIRLCQLYPDYMLALQDYRQALASRNAVLRSARPDPATLDAFDAVLVPAGARVLERRLAFCDGLAAHIQRLAGQMFPADHALLFRYRPTIDIAADGTSEASFQAALEGSRTRDLEHRYTHVGPHRDDWNLQLNERSLGQFGSEGQCRLAALVIKMASVALIREQNADMPLLMLVDDVIGELDMARRQAFFDTVSRAAQLFVAGTDEGVKELVKPEATFTVTSATAERV